MSAGRIHRITSLDDPRVGRFHQLRDRDLARKGEVFIAEGEHLLRRLVHSSFEVESVLLTDRRAAELEPIIPAHVPVFVAPAELVDRIIGFHFHSGVIACGRRKPPLRLADAAASWGDQVTLVICPEIANTENLGSLIRVSAAFGATAMLLGERSCDPFYRQAVRVSMGTIFYLPIIQSENIQSDLTLLARRGMDLCALVLDADSQPLAKAGRGKRLGLMFGNEAQGLSPADVAACGRKITIPMQLGTDSLNVAVSAGIVLYHFTQRLAAGV